MWPGPRRHSRLLWGIDRAILPHEPLHAVIVALMRRALDVAAAAAEAEAKAGGAQRKALTGAGRGGGGGAGGNADGANNRRGGAGSGNNSSSSNGGRLESLLDDVRDLVTGREAALRVASAHIASTYMHHVFWPHSPYLLVVTTRSILLARINRAAATAAGRGQALQQVVNLCWQTAVVTHAALATAAAAALAPSQGAVATGTHGLKRTASVILTSSSSSAAAGAGVEAAAHPPPPPPSRYQQQQLPGRTAGRAAGASSGLLAGHVAYTHLLDAMAEVASEAATAVEASARQLSGNSFPASSSSSPARLRLLKPGPSHTMALDALVQSRFRTLSGRPSDDPIFRLPQHLLEAMTSAVDPLPLHFGDAIATVANVRPDVSPKANVQSMTACLAYIDAAWGKYVRDRVAWLESGGGGGGVSSAAGTGELDRLRACGGRMSAEELTPVFHFVLAKSQVDRPLLCAVLGTTWLGQHGLNDGRSGYALTMFKAACYWTASLAL